MPVRLPASSCPSFASSAIAFSRRRLAAGLVACLASAAPLGGCGYEDASRFAPVCPKVSVLADAADVTVYRASSGGGAGRDLTDMVLDGRVTGLAGKCARASDTLLATHVTLSMQFSRGPAAATREMEVPYFIGVFEGDDDILDKKVIPIRLVFPPNVDRLSLDTQDVELDLPISTVKSGAIYTVRVGFQLTPEQLALNRRRGAAQKRCVTPARNARRMPYCGAPTPTPVPLRIS